MSISLAELWHALRLSVMVQLCLAVLLGGGRRAATWGASPPRS